MRTPPDSSAFRTDIQGLRAIAVLLVVLYHSGVAVLSGGYVGVDVFFVISGFLITTHLLGTLQRDGRLHFADFYARRARRILPASFAVLIATVLASAIWVNPLQFTQVLEGAVWTALYVPNYLFAAQGTNYLAETIPSLFQHYWSLGIEEQFYLLWPALLAGSFVVLRRRTARLKWIILAVGIISFIACLFLVARVQPWAFFSLPTRAWELAAGGLVAALLLRRPRWATTRLAGIGAWIGLVAVIGSGFVLTSSTTFPGTATLLPVLGTAALIIGGSRATTWSPAWVLSLSPMLFIGKISYSLYLVHWPLLQIPQAAVGYDHPLPLWVTLLLGLAGVPIAWLSFRFIEEPFRTSPRAKKARPATTLWATAATSGVVAAVALTGMFVTIATPVSSGRVVQVSAVLTVPPTVPPFVPANLAPPLRSSGNDNAIVYSDGCHQEEGDQNADGCWFGTDDGAPTVVLFGDSHAASWFPAFDELAEAGKIRLNSNSKSSCGSVLYAEERVKQQRPSCDVWRRAVIDRLRQDPPDVIALANFATSRLGGEADPGTAWGEALAKTIAELPSQSRVVILADTPDFRVTPALCLSAHVDDTSACAVPRSEALDDRVRQAEQNTTGADWIDLTDRICDEKNCYPIVDNFLVTRDAHHMTKSFASALAPALEKKLDRVLP